MVRKSKEIFRKLKELVRKPREIFRQVHDSGVRFLAIVAHRRAGKTVATLNHMIRDCVSSKKHASQYAYIAPYLKQAKSIAWKYLK